MSTKRTESGLAPAAQGRVAEAERAVLLAAFRVADLLKVFAPDALREAVNEIGDKVEALRVARLRRKA